MIQTKRPSDAQILVGARTVWVNDAYGCLGRFGLFGIDVHRTLAAQMEGQSECLDCTHGPATLTDWTRFKQAMLHFHGVDLSHLRPPVWLTNRSHEATTT